MVSKQVKYYSWIHKIFCLLIGLPKSKHQVLEAQNRQEENLSEVSHSEANHKAISVKNSKVDDQEETSEGAQEVQEVIQSRFIKNDKIRIYFINDMIITFSYLIFLSSFSFSQICLLQILPKISYILVDFQTSLLLFSWNCFDKS